MSGSGSRINLKEHSMRVWLMTCLLHVLSRTPAMSAVSISTAGLGDSNLPLPRSWELLPAHEPMNGRKTCPGGLMGQKNIQLHSLVCNFILFLCVGILSSCDYTASACNIHIGQKRALDPLVIGRWLLATIFVLGTEPRSFAGALGVLIH